MNENIADGFVGALKKNTKYRNPPERVNAVVTIPWVITILILLICLFIFVKLLWFSKIR